MNPDLRLLEGTLQRLRLTSPFFATLALFAQVRFTRAVPVAATDGERIFLNPDALRELDPSTLDAVFLHELLHAACLHPVRRGTRTPLLWNLAADIVVNGILAEAGFLRMPEGFLRDPALEHLPVEEVYEALDDDDERVQRLTSDLLEPGDPEDADADRARLQAEWAQATAAAAALTAAQGQGQAPAGLLRQIEAARSTVPWRKALWRFVARTPVDFTGFDRRHIGRGLFLDVDEPLPARVLLAVDTSGSITQALLATFLGEVRQIAATYPELDLELAWFDAALHGPWPLHRHLSRSPVGGGGTDFRPVFEHAATRHGHQRYLAVVVLTDGYGTFPRDRSPLPVLWVVPAGGRSSSEFPFGEVVRTLDEGTGSDREQAR